MTHKNSLTHTAKQPFSPAIESYSSETCNFRGCLHLRGLARYRPLFGLRPMAKANDPGLTPMANIRPACSCKIPLTGRSMALRSPIPMGPTTIKASSLASTCWRENQKEPIAMSISTTVIFTMSTARWPVRDMAASMSTSRTLIAAYLTIFASLTTGSFKLGA